MMKAKAIVTVVVVFLVVVLAAGVLFAQQSSPKGKVVAPAKARLPDLIIEKITLRKDCRVAVKVKNLGPGVVPDEVWTVHTPKSAGVYLYRNGTGWGGGAIWRFDPAKNLQRPGGTAIYESNLEVAGSATIKAVVDRSNVVKEKNEGNNSLGKKLTCKLPVGKCCIAGTYEGTSVDDPKCPVGPKRGKFILTIKQANCGSKIEGVIMDPATSTITARLKGTVTPGPGKCCTIVGRTKGEPGTKDAKCEHEIKATLCRKGGKWYTTNGIYRDISGNCCSGKFDMKQR